MNQKDFYYRERQYAEKDGNMEYANACKNKYKELVLALLKKPYNLYIEKLKQYPIIYLN